MSDAREVLTQVMVRDERARRSSLTSPEAFRVRESALDVVRLVQALTAVLDLHRRIDGDLTDDSDVEPWCAECRLPASETGDPFMDWPCPTVRAITEALGADNAARTDPEMPNGGPCPTCGKQVALPLLEGHLELHRTRGVDR